MFNSIQNRLWLSYFLLVIFILAIVTGGLFLSFSQSSVLYRQSILQLRLAEAEIIPQIRVNLLPAQQAQLIQILKKEAEQRQIRLIVLRPNYTILFDTGAGDGSTINRLPRLNTGENDDKSKDGTFRDSKGRVWLYSQREILRGFTLITATLRPALALRTALRDELINPILWAGVGALVVSLLLAFFMSKGITDPLNTIVSAAQVMAKGQYPSILVSGPKEVQHLAKTLNNMAQKVQISQQSQRDLVANVSHELKTPLTSIQGFSQAILDGTASSPEAINQAARIIYKESDRMNRLVMDLLSLAKLEAGTADLQYSQVDLTRLLTQVIDKFLIQAQQNNIKLTKDIPELLLCLGDGDRLSQVFSNLIDNALKFSGKDGNVAVRAWRSNGEIVVSVKDTGIGIEPDDQNRIFERFFQVEKSRSGGESRGIGLGLAIARQIVLAHNGKIWVKSVPGKGSEFFVELPLSSPEKIALSDQRKKG